MATLKDHMPHEFVGGEYHDTAAFALRDVVVITEHDGAIKRWPGKHKNVHHWVELANGKAVAFNENPGRGWSFPVIVIKNKAEV